MVKAHLFIALLLSVAACFSTAFAADCTDSIPFEASKSLPSGAVPTKVKIVLPDHHGSDFDVDVTTGTTSAASVSGTVYTDEKVTFSAAISFDASTGTVNVVVSEDEPSSGSLIKSSMGNIVTSLAACSYLASENPSKKVIFSAAAAYGIMSLATASAACDFKADVAVVLPVGYTATISTSETDASKGIYVYTISTTTASPTSPTTPAPSVSPTYDPTAAPITSAPSKAPTTAAPTTSAPSKAPTTSAPSKAPTTSAPSKAPTTAPTTAPSKAPTTAPSKAPTSAPTTAPTSAPTSAPTASPTDAPVPE